MRSNALWWPTPLLEDDRIDPWVSFPWSTRGQLEWGYANSASYFFYLARQIEDVADLLESHPAAFRNIESAGMSDRISAQAGDFLCDDLPQGFDAAAAQLINGGVSKGNFKPGTRSHSNPADWLSAQD